MTEQRKQKAEAKRAMLIKKHIEKMWGGLEMASIQYFQETGRISGSLYLRLHAMLKECETISATEGVFSTIKLQAACEKCEGEREKLQKILGNLVKCYDIGDLNSLSSAAWFETAKQFLEQFKTQSHESGNES